MSPDPKFYVIRSIKEHFMTGLKMIEDREPMSPGELKAAEEIFTAVMEFMVQSDVIEDYNDRRILEILKQCKE